jgi:hypothetical protein
MPQETMKFAGRDQLNKLRNKYNYDGVIVPKWSDTRECRWHPHMNLPTGKDVFIPFEVMIDVMEFSLDNTIIKMPNGKLRRQTKGVPMGSPISPGITITTCAWMEHEWMQTIDPRDKQRFRAKRYMDDILLIYAKNKTWDHEKFVKDFERSECYQEPLSLEDGGENVFLETEFSQLNGVFNFKLKNENAKTPGKIWRYRHFKSHAPFAQKRAVLTACLQKIHKMASDADIMCTSAIDKLIEFRAIGYPFGVLYAACRYMGASTGVRKWLDIPGLLLQVIEIQNM